MNEELRTCTAAFFRNKGKDVITVKELTMTISLDLRWMPVKEAARFAELIVAEGIVTKTQDSLLKPSEEIKALDVPVAYKPSKDLLNYIVTAKPPVQSKPAEVRKPAAPPKASGAPLPKLVAMAESKGIKKGAFIAECNKIVKKLNVDMEVAALIVLRDLGADVSGMYGEVYDFVSAK
ncbi:MAG: DUF2240 family protein [Candidatus Methanomethylophilaceae archaeon]|nr:DUF2240 family protein [Candidatus Methanomethylophilaceae archaeon]